MVERNGIKILGLSPTFVRTMKAKGVRRKFAHIKAFASTGEPWDNESWKWLFEHYGGSKVPICNISGGTDIIGCFLASTPAMPLKPRCLYRGLGMNVSVYDEEGKDTLNQVGYLVSKSHCPSMTRGILGSDSRYLDSYWSKFKGVWYQGDWAEMDEDGYFFLYGRADEVIKVAGKRVGPNEIEDSVNAVNGVVESAATGIPDPIKGEAIAIFYTGKPDSEVLTGIKSKVEIDLGKSFGPKYIFHLDALPKTRSGKIMRRAIRDAFLHKEQGDLTGIDDHTILDKIRNLRDTETRQKT
jgi:Acyl-coenzyme A synthetases/AMP-(fatty) acid ligases